MSDTKRKSGYYTAKRRNEPIVLKYESKGDYFTVCGVDYYFEESDFTDIQPLDFHKEQSQRTHLISLENALRNHLDEVERSHEYEIATDSVRAWIDLYNESNSISKEQSTQSESERPKFKNFFPENTLVVDINNAFLANPQLYSYVQAMDGYIDELEAKSETELSGKMKEAVETIELLISAKPIKDLDERLAYYKASLTQNK